METEQSDTTVNTNSDPLMKLLLVEMGVGMINMVTVSYAHFAHLFRLQDITAAAMRACRDAISLVSVDICGGLMYHFVSCGKILDIKVVDGGLICSSGVHVEETGDKNDDCYIVNAAVYVGY
ncbi:uncharacterized protein LOC119987829 [Tripterygium wilfordii]|uniref:uncharacterized protein LOC119987829 n=1 Tax=Tripterygium wilfordii TaxID=458696 RepID=UPI0018F86489|nr:uncharacterized protein LOC119987829 [Tripterygium wilfordii]